ncbi:MAG: hypothetical protein AB8B96_17095 [Lysobacterales bacterium]
MTTFSTCRPARLTGVALTFAFLLCITASGRAQNLYPASCFEPGLLPTFADSHVEGNPFFDYPATLSDATNPRAFSAQVEIRAWRVPCHTNGSALLLRVTAFTGLPIAPQVFVEQGENAVQVRLAAEAHTLATDESGRQLLLQGDSTATLVVESTASSDAAGINLSEALTLVIRDALFDRTAEFPAYRAEDFAVPQYQRISARHSGSWFNRIRNGEGVVVEFAQGDVGLTAVVSWYTFLAGEQQWLIGSADVAPGSREVNVPMIRARGAQFGEAFDRADVQREDWGSLTLRFLDCQQLDMAYDGLDGAGEIRLQRLTEVAQLRC